MFVVAMQSVTCDTGPRPGTMWFMFSTGTSINIYTLATKIKTLQIVSTETGGLYT